MLLLFLTSTVHFDWCLPASFNQRVFLFLGETKAKTQQPPAGLPYSVFSSSGFENSCWQTRPATQSHLVSPPISFIVCGSLPPELWYIYAGRRRGQSPLTVPCGSSTAFLWQDGFDLWPLQRRAHSVSRSRDYKENITRCKNKKKKKTWQHL